MIRRTKIVATIGPATFAPEALEELIKAGMNIARLNLSHGDHESHRKTIRSVREIAKRLGRPVGILLDLAGPKIRTGPMAEGIVQLREGDPFTLTTRDVPGNNRETSLTYKHLPRDVKVGDTLYLADAALRLRVTRVTKEDVSTVVEVGGPLGSRKGINLPGRSISAPILSDKDRADLEFGLSEEVDYVALSFVRNAEDVRIARRVISMSGRVVPIIAKIEKHEALDTIDEILTVVDGLMVARGDLGVEIPLEQVPRAQKMLIEKANHLGKPVITATQMLKSMVDNPRPTRAETSDVANAILDGTDAVMLSEETAEGKYPAESVRIMCKIARETEKIFPFDAWTFRFGTHPSLKVYEAVAHAATRLADTVGAGAIVTCTQSGSTTRLVSKYRPKQPILAMTPSKRTFSRLPLIWGAVPILMDSSDLDGIESQAIRLARESGFVKNGDFLVITVGLPLNVPGTTNLIKVARVEEKT